MTKPETTSAESPRLWALRERTVSAEERRQWTEKIAAVPDSHERKNQSALVFRLGTEWLALATSAFREVAPITPIHSLPHRGKGAVLGIANVRGELLTCISIRELLSIAEAPGAQDAAGRFLVVDHRAHRFVIPVDQIDAVIKFNPSALTPVPATLMATAGRVTSGILRIGGRAINHLETSALMTHIERVFV